MLVEASITGLFKTLLMIIGALVVLRFFGRFMIAKRILEEERELLEKERNFEKEKKRVFKNMGKVEIIKKKK